MKKYILTPLLAAALFFPLSAAHAQFEGILFGTVATSNPEGNAPTLGGGFNDITPGAGSVTLDAHGVIALQNALTSAGYYHGPINGSLDAGTSAAIKSYQRGNNLDVSGAADAYTLDRLGIGNRFGITAGTSFNN
jgi:hypothetical protein